MNTRYPFVAVAAFSLVGLDAQTSVLTQHNDLSRTGQNINETTLTPANVNTASFGKLFSLAVDGPIYGQPLYVPNVSIPGQGVHNVVFVTTQHDSVYAFDADTIAAPLWKISLLDTAHGAGPGAIPEPITDLNNCGDIPVEVGVTGTPVIDPAAGTIYMVAKTNENGQVVQRLHALSIATGAERSNSPAVIQGSVAGTGAGSSGGLLQFDPKWSLQRAGLLLFNGYVYIAFGSHCDFNSWHGWMVAYNGTTMQQSSILAMTPDGSGSGVWMSGGAPAAEVLGPIQQIFVSTGNGSFDGSRDFGDDLLKLTTNNGVMAIADQFTPLDQAALNAVDADLSSGGVLLLPDQTVGGFQHLLVSAGKMGRVYVVNRDNMGAFNPTYNNVVQDLPNALAGLWGTPAYWNNNVYFWGSTYQEGTSPEPLKAFSLSGGRLSATPVSMSSRTTLFPGPGVSISANGNSNGIVWAVLADAFKNGGDAVLTAHDATNVATLLYASDQNPARDRAGRAVKFTTPTIANGKVYTGSWTTLNVYGPLSAGAGTIGIAPNILNVTAGTSVSAQVTASTVVAFSATGLPTGVSASFSPITGATSTITLTAASNAPASVSTSTVAGAYGGSRISTLFGINVTAGSGGGGTLPYGVGVTPAAGSATAGTAANLQFNWASPAGQATLVWGSLVIQDSANPSPGTVGTCYLRAINTGAVQLADNNGAFSNANNYTGLPYALTQSNSHCQLNGLASAPVQFTNNGASLQATLNLQFNPLWAAKTLTIWLQGTNTGYQNGNWTQLGTFTVGSTGGIGGTLPTAVSLTPSTNSATVGTPANLQFAWASPAGQPGLAWSSIIIQDAAVTAPGAGNACYLRVHVSGAVQLADDTGAFTNANNYTGQPWASTQSNSHCQLNGLASSAVQLSNNGSAMQVTLNLQVLTPWAGSALAIWMQGTNTSYQSGNWTQLGTIAVAAGGGVGGGNGTLPSGVSVSPPTGSGASGVPSNLQLNWSSPAGQPPMVWASLVLQDSAIISPGTVGVCYLRVHTSGAVQFADDNGAFTGGNNYTGLPYAFTQSNSHCQLNGLSSSPVQLTGSGSGMQVTLNLQFLPAWSGKTLGIWLQGTNTNYQPGSWSQLGTFTVTGSGVGGGTLPYGVSVSPATNSATAGTPSSFQFNWASPAGQAGLIWATVIIQNAATPAPVSGNVCYLRVNITGAVQLADDSGNFSYGNDYTGQPYATTQANTYCQLNGLSSSGVQVASDASTLQVKLNLQFLPSWSGTALSVWMQGTNSNYLPGPWAQLGTITVR